MKINSVLISPKLYDSNGQMSKQMRTVTGIMNDVQHDSVEISPIGRQLSVGAIEHHVGSYYGNVDIHETLQRILEGKSPEVRKAVYTIIESNLAPGGSVPNEVDRYALQELGLSQAKYVARHYFGEEEGSELLSTLNNIAVLSRNRSDGTAVGANPYREPTPKPVGAPDDYVNITDLMRRFAPESHQQMEEAIINGGDWFGVLMKFAQQIPQNKDWMKKYREEMDAAKKEALPVKLDSRFDKANLMDIQTFSKDVQQMLQQLPRIDRETMDRNNAYFAHVIGHTVASKN
ncbi:hypothetical protein AZ66_12500 [Paenibacillus sp. E194]|uniref:hypothetical protein n=1 Tax=Paenibacillus sp. E194 TaxID=1458845 RepID=UPI0005C80346|nr:hypothetical protein [Paenibacillus sp. E194]KJB87534.1 hypothetical protein AZ66_12500 [Paenibacillus sp. E194]